MCAGRRLGRRQWQVWYVKGLLRQFLFMLVHIRCDSQQGSVGSRIVDEDVKLAVSYLRHLIDTRCDAALVGDFEGQGYHSVIA